MEILGIKVDNLSKQEILEKTESFLSDGKFHQIATINSEFILAAQKDEEFKDILNNCTLNIADSMGIKFAFWWMKDKLKYRMTGADLMQEILKLANEKNLSVFLAVNKNGLSSYEETRDALSEKYPKVEFSGENIDPKNCHMSHFTCHGALLCNFGAPYQEKFINSVKNDSPPHLSVGLSDDTTGVTFENDNLNSNFDLRPQRCGGILGVAMGVGGSFDYATGKLKRAPQIMRILGLEWLWRLILQPKRWKRIWKAVIIFPIKVIFNK